jgi:hypothetical protein
MTRGWSDDVELENRTYCCIYELGIEWLCPETRVIAVGSKGEGKEIDVLASSENAVFVFEAKCYEVGGGNLNSTEIDELFSRCDLIRKSLDRGDQRKYLE